MDFHIVTPVLNGARFFDAAIQSVRLQTWPDWRLTILDGGSDDGSQDIARRHVEQDARIELKTEADNGQYDALRRGFDAAEGDIFAWLNSDDMYTPWAFATLAELFSNPGWRWVSGLPAHWDEQGRMTAVKPAAAASRSLIRRGWRHDSLLGCIQQESSFFTAGLWRSLDEAEKDRFAGLKLAGDYYLWKCFAERAELHAVPTVLGGFRISPGNRSRALKSTYQDEVKACGAVRMPGPLATLFHEVHDHAAALFALRAFRRALRDLLARAEKGS